MVAKTQADALLSPSEEHSLLRQTVRDFVSREVEPQAEEHDRDGVLNVGLMRKCGELGLHGVTIPDDDGGAGLDATASVIVHEELAYADPGFCLAYLAHAVLFVNNLLLRRERGAAFSLSAKDPVGRVDRRDGNDRAVGWDRCLGHEDRGHSATVTTTF